MKKILNHLPALLIVLACCCIPFASNAGGARSIVMAAALPGPNYFTISAVDTASITTTGTHSQALVTGSPTIGSVKAWSTGTYPTVAVTIGALTGTSSPSAPTVSFEKSNDGGTTWVAWQLYQPGTTVTTSTATAVGIFVGQVGDATNFRIRGSLGLTMSATGTVAFFPASNAYGVTNAAQPEVVADQGAGNGASPWYNFLVDSAGTNVAGVDSSHRVLTYDTLAAGAAVTSNAGTNLNTSLLALESGGNLATVATQTTTTATQTTTTATNTGTIAGAVSASKMNVNLSSGYGSSWSGYPLTPGTGLTTVQTVSGSAGLFGGYLACVNLTSAPAYIEVFDTTGAVTLGTTVPTYEFVIPANATAANGAAANLSIPGGLVIANGIKVAAVTASKGSSAVGTAVFGTIIYH